jgi:hypothetical protein
MIVSHEKLQRVCEAGAARGFGSDVDRRARAKMDDTFPRVLCAVIQCGPGVTLGGARRIEGFACRAAAAGTERAAATFITALQAE